MPDLISSIDFISDLPLYQYEKPYVVLTSPRDEHNDNIETDNLVFESREGINFTDIRGREQEFRLETSGFEIISHHTAEEDVRTAEEIERYKKEMEELLKRRFKAEAVYCWDVKLRLNEPHRPRTYDILDPTIPDGAAKGAHVDVSAGSGPNIINNNLPQHFKEEYFKLGYRFRIVNTWRPLHPMIEDNPLAFCDFRSIDKNDLVACDRILPHRAGEVYYLKYNPHQRWCWIEHMTKDEPLLFIMYDSAEGPQARYCPHVSIKNPRASPTAPKRRSVETRTIIITRDG